tara:strand:+ start:34629 stop:35099 length:471 start_codon:yes stop_codon:yes gene_type:complete
MLEILAAANAAFAVIKKTIENGKDIASCGAAISKFVQSEDKLQADLHKKKNSIWTTFLGKEDSDLEEFMALEQIRAKKEQLREYMQLYGRAGLYQDYLKFCAEARKQRKENAEKIAKKKRELEDLLLKIFLYVLLAIFGSGLIFVVVFILRKKGMI